MALPARARPEGHTVWRDAHVLNASRSGVLLAVADSCPPAESFDLVFAVTDGTVRTAEVRCVVQVVRESQDMSGRPLLAATIAQYAITPVSMSV